jgi:hypothetical protein
MHEPAAAPDIVDLDLLFIYLLLRYTVFRIGQVVSDTLSMFSAGACLCTGQLLCTMPHVRSTVLLHIIWVECTCSLFDLDKHAFAHRLTWGESTFKSTQLHRSGMLCQPDIQLGIHFSLLVHRLCISRVCCMPTSTRCELTSAPLHVYYEQGFARQNSRYMSACLLC